MHTCPLTLVKNRGRDEVCWRWSVSLYVVHIDRLFRSALVIIITFVVVMSSVVVTTSVAVTTSVSSATRLLCALFTFFAVVIMSTLLIWVVAVAVRVFLFVPFPILVSIGVFSVSVAFTIEQRV